MKLDNQYCPFVHWNVINKCIPEGYYVSEDGCPDYSWFQNAPKYSTFRVNTKKYSTNEILDTFSLHFQKEGEARCSVPPSVSVHPLLSDCIVIGPWHYKCGTADEALEDVIIDVPCANSVLRGADVFAPAILGLSPNVQIGDKVNIFCDIHRKCLRGYSKKFEGDKIYVGHGILKMDRETLFKNNACPKGVGVEVIENLTGVPRITLPRNFGILQNLPSIVCGHLFSEVKGRVLDMCAAPGNKTSHIATLLGNKVAVLALDKTPSKVARLEKLCSEMELDNVFCFSQDSTKCVSHDNGDTDKPPFEPESFSAVLLDPPCSGLGQRPVFSSLLSQSHLASFPPLQRRLFSTAVAALEPGGILVYSTCTITVEENEDMVGWALQKYPELSLTELTPYLGKPGIPTDSLPEKERLLVNRFGSLHPASSDEDTIGFFIAKFVKKME